VKVCIVGFSGNLGQSIVQYALGPSHEATAIVGPQTPSTLNTPYYRPTHTTMCDEANRFGTTRPAVQ
jgi:putative NADH-flavin reductase